MTAKSRSVDRPPVAESVGDLARELDLGEPGLVLYPIPGAGSVMFGTVFFLIFGAIFIGVSASQVGSHPVGASILLFIGVAAIGAAVYRLLQSPAFSKQAAAKSVCVFERGLIMAELDGPREVFEWDTLQLYQWGHQTYDPNGELTPSECKLTLTGPDGSVRINSTFYQNVEELRALIQQQAGGAQLEKTYRSITTGTEVAFGPITLDAAGVRYTPDYFKGGSARWEEVKGFTVEAGVFELRLAGQDGSWTRLRVHLVPNFSLFLVLIGLLQSAPD